LERKNGTNGTTGTNATEGKKPIANDVWHEDKWSETSKMI
jgi:hypothetical protein